MAIVFRNPGVIDPASIKTFGVSSKEKAGAIGFFGTGLKYAIAILLREGCRITIHSGGERMEFATEQARVRVNDFTFITMNGERLAFTTELGKTWDVSGAFRELYCNCVDEGGAVYQHDTEGANARPDETVITVDGEAFHDVWARRSEIILDKEPLFKHEGLHICPGASDWAYYRGVRALKLPHPSRYTYNVMRKLDLTEDRTVKYPWEVEYAVRAAWMEGGPETAHHLQRVLVAPRESFEAQLSWGGALPSPTFLETVRMLDRRFEPGLNRTAVEACRAWLMDALVDEAPMTLNAVEAKRLERAVDFCERIGFSVRQYPIIVSEFLGAEVLGRAHNERIFVSKRALMMGTKMLAGTLIEEFLHLRHKITDETRSMQNFLMDTIVSLGEQLIGEPL